MSQAMRGGAYLTNVQAVFRTPYSPGANRARIGLRFALADDMEPLELAELSPEQRQIFVDAMHEIEKSAWYQRFIASGDITP